MLCTIGVTPDGVTRWPMHRHDFPEIMCYLSGEGVLRLSEGGIPFSPGTVIFVPAGVMHGSHSERGFQNMSIGAEFPALAAFSQPLALPADINSDAFRLASMIVQNHHTPDEYLASLLAALSQYMLRAAAADFTPDAAAAVRRIREEMTARFADSTLCAHALLQKSGYAPDYIRAQFRRQVGLTPVQFLTQLRIEHAARLLDIYGASLPVSEVCARCGFADSVYFSHKFKERTGLSPRAYIKRRRP